MPGDLVLAGIGGSLHEYGGHLARLGDGVPVVLGSTPGNVAGPSFGTMDSVATLLCDP